MKLPHFIYLLMTIVFVMPGCTSGGSTITPLSTPTLVPSSTATPTFTPRLQPTVTSSPVPTMTPTRLPTLTPNEAREALATLLQKPVDCEAPCFWSIAPGETTFGEAVRAITHFGLQLLFVNTIDNKDFRDSRYDFDNGLSVDVNLAIQDNIVQNVRVSITPEKQRTGMPRAWLAYSPETFINRYGTPSKVEFFLDWGPRPYFEMDMYFDQVDLIVVYEGHNIIPREKGSPRICPLTSQFEAVRLWMGKDPYQPPRPAVPLDQATSMTLEEFANLMTGDPGKACFIVNGDAFK